MFIDSGEVTFKCGNEPPVMTNREELKIYAIIKEWEKLIAQVWRGT